MHMRHPHPAQLAHAPSCAQTMGRNVRVQPDCQVLALHLRHQQWGIVHSCCFHTRGYFHTLRFPTFRVCVQVKANREFFARRFPCCATRRCGTQCCCQVLILRARAAKSKAGNDSLLRP